MRNLCRVLCWLSLITPLWLQAGTLAQFRTALGDIEVELLDFDKPVTVQNFVHYVQTGAYVNSFFHRWVPQRVLQGGGFIVTNLFTTNANFAAIQYAATITNEYLVGRTFSNTYGTIAMARESGKTNSATTQWFFNLSDNAVLDTVDGGFTVFGQVVRGTNVLDLFSPKTTNTVVYLLQNQAPFNELPVLSTKPTLLDLVYVDVTLLNVHVAQSAGGEHEISWRSVSNKVNRVEFTTQTPPVWQDLVSTNGTGQIIKVLDPDRTALNRFYRVRVDY